MIINKATHEQKGIPKFKCFIKERILNLTHGF